MSISRYIVASGNDENRRFPLNQTRALLRSYARGFITDTTIMINNLRLSLLRYPGEAWNFSEEELANLLTVRTKIDTFATEVEKIEYINEIFDVAIISEYSKMDLYRTEAEMDTILGIAVE